MPTKLWESKPQAPQSFLDQFPALSPAILQLLWNRNISAPAAMKSFFEPELVRDAHDPFAFRGMREAIDRIKEALRKEERTIVFGDFDADGVCGATILYEALREIGAQVTVHIPDRFADGHGLTRACVQELAEQEVGLIITVDCGVSNVEEIALAKTRGMDVIVLDHHQVPPKLPEAVAIVDAWQSGDTYPFKMLCGTGVAFKTAQAMLAGGLVPPARVTKFQDALRASWLELAAIATIADMVALSGENRLFTKLGVKALPATTRPGLKALFSVSGLASPAQLNERFVAFALAPRINAASRMDHANSAFWLLTTESQEEAMAAAQLLDKKNTERQQKVEEAFRNIQDIYSAKTELPPMIIEAAGTWSPGILGIAANKILELFARPAFLFAHDPAKKQYRGSGRAPKSFDLVKAMRGCGEELFEEFGGHPQAAGATIAEEKFERFQECMMAAAEQWLTESPKEEGLMIEAELAPQEIDPRLAVAVQDFAPFGMGNPAPRFLVRDLEISTMRAIGNGEKHLQLTLLGKGPERSYEIPAILFNHATVQKNLRPGDRIDVVCELLYEEWRGRKELKLKIVDVKRIGQSSA